MAPAFTWKNISTDKPAVMAAEAKKNIAPTMEKHRVKRLVVVSVVGIAVPQGKRRFSPSILSQPLSEHESDTCGSG
ncbi:MAG TPA: hypothetical protein VFZ43_08900 [Anaerolineales bacterium]